MGVKCDDLLREEKDYTDIQKTDIQQYLPFIVSVGSIILFYLLLVLKVPILITFALLCCSMGFSFYLMLHHTDKKHLSTLTKFNVILSYFPISAFLNKGIVMLLMMKYFGMQGFFIQGISETMQNGNNGMELGMDMVSSFIIMPIIGYAITLLLCIMLYVYLEKFLKKRYEISKECVKRNEKVFKNIKMIGDILTGVSIVLVFVVLLYWYKKLLVPIDVSNMYMMDHMNDMLFNIKITSLLCILPAFVYQCIVFALYHKQWSFIRNLLILVIYTGGIIFLTYIDGIYVTSPILYIGIGAVIIAGELLYEVVRYRKKTVKQQ